jgi:hypothetical protein
MMIQSGFDPGFAETTRPLSPEEEAMDAKRFVIGTVVGGIVLYLVGYLMFVKLFGPYYAANAGSATGVDRTQVVQWAIALGSLAYGALVTYAMGNRVGALSIGRGAAVGAIVGFLLWCTADLIQYGSSNVANLTRTVVDPLLEIVHGGIGGAAIAAALRRVPAVGQNRV